MAKPTKTKKKERKNILQGVVHIQSTFNNTIVTSTDTQGNAVAWASAGGCGFKGARKGTPFAAQAVSFFVISLALLILARPVLDKAMKKNRVKTNIDSLIGEKAKVTEKINNIDETGAVFINGLTWTARSEDSNKIIEPGEVVEIKAVSGVKLIVQ